MFEKNLNFPREKYKMYEGNFTEQMSMLIGHNRVPMNTMDFMKRLLELNNLSGDLYKGVKTSWAECDQEFTTGDAVAFNPNGNIKIIPDCQYLRETGNGNNDLGIFYITKDIYDKLETKYPMKTHFPNPEVNNNTRYHIGPIGIYGINNDFLVKFRGNILVGIAPEVQSTKNLENVIN
jgi:hypothetical protein